MKDPLGLNENITRRDFLNSMLVGSGAMLLTSLAPIHLLAQQGDWNGFSGIGDYAGCNGNTYEVLTAGHAIRDLTFEDKLKSATETGEHFDCVIVGAGISALAAAFFLQKGTKPRSCLLLDGDGIFGGEAKQNEFVVDGTRLIAHQGSAVFFPPFEGSSIDEFYRTIDLDWKQFRYQRSSLPLGNTPYLEDGATTGIYFGEAFGRKQGVWIKDPWTTKLQGAPLSATDKDQLLRLHGDGAEFKKPEKHGDEISRQLDSITLEDHIIRQHGVSKETVRRFAAQTAGGGSGASPDVLSAYSDYAADVLVPWDQKAGVQMFPGGNTGIARHILKKVIPSALPGPNTLRGIAHARVQFSELDKHRHPVRIRLKSTVLKVRHEGEPDKADKVSVIHVKGGKLYRVTASSAIIAGGSWTARHIVEGLPETHAKAYAQFFRSPCLMANVAVRNWRFLSRLGLTEAQWYEGVGSFTAVRRVATFGAVSPTLNPDIPTVLNLKVLFPHPGASLEEQSGAGRIELLMTPYSDYERQIRKQFTRMFARAGFDAKRDIAGIILNRWGHAYLSPQPGFFFGKNGEPAPGEVLRSKPFGRIAFANSDLTGIMDHRTSILEAQRAVQQVIESSARKS